MKALDATNEYLSRAMTAQEIPKRRQELLEASRREVHVSVQVELDNGDITHFSGFRVQHEERSRSL